MHGAEGNWTKREPYTLYLQSLSFLFWRRKRGGGGRRKRRRKGTKRGGRGDEEEKRVPLGLLQSSVSHTRARNQSSNAAEVSFSNEADVLDVFVFVKVRVLQ